MAEDVLAPLSGTIWKITAAPGEVVEEDDEVLIIEALKMETPIFAPCDSAAPIPPSQHIRPHPPDTVALPTLSKTTVR